MAVRVSISVLLFVLVALNSAAGLWPLSKVEFAPEGGDQLEPTICAGDDGFLVAWSDIRAGSLSTRATRLDAEGNVLDVTGIEVSSEGCCPYAPPAIVWNGSNWLVIVPVHRGISVVAIPPRDAESGGALSPQEFETTFYPVEAIEVRAIRIRDRVFVAGAARSGAFFMILDALGAIVSPARSIRSTGYGYVRLASNGNEVLLLDFGQELVAHRLRPDGEIIGSTSLGQTNSRLSEYELTRHGDDFLFVFQTIGGGVESWTISAETGSVVGSVIVSPDLPSSVSGTGVALLPAAYGTEILFTAESRTAPGSYVVCRATQPTHGVLDQRSCGLDARPPYILRADSSVTRTVLVTGRYGILTHHDLVVRSASSLDAIAAAPANDLTLSVREQRSAVVVRGGTETLASWVEPDPNTGDPRLCATTIDGMGRPSGITTVLFGPDDAHFSYAIASRGPEYLVARLSRGTLWVRVLQPDLRWRDSAWTPVADCVWGDLRDSVAWDGEGWWVGWMGECETPGLRVQRFGTELQALTGVVDPGATEDAMYPPQLISLSGTLLVVWTHDPYPICVFPACPRQRLQLLGVRISRSGAVLKSETRIVDEVESEAIALTSSGSEVLAAWGTAAGLEVTRLTADLVARDVTIDSGSRRGTLLESDHVLIVDLGWDGEHWVAALETTKEGYNQGYKRTFHRFVGSTDPGSAWRAGEVRDLGSNADGYQWVGPVAAGEGGATVVLRKLVSAATTGVPRYYVENMSQKPRLRGVRR